MGLRFYANAPGTQLSSGVTNSATSIVVDSVAGLPVSFPYTLILDRGSSTEEVVEVSDASGNTLTVARGVDSTTAFSHSSGASVEHGISARDIREANTHINSSAGVHGLAGALVGTNDTQALTNKDLSDATNTFPTTLATDAEVAAAQAAAEATAAAALDAHATDTSVHWEPGDIKMVAYAAADPGWSMCDGQELSRTTEAALFAKIGTTYGVGDGSTTFNKPDLRGRFPYGAGGGGKVLGDHDDAPTISSRRIHTLHTHDTTLDGSHDHGKGTLGMESVNRASGGLITGVGPISGTTANAGSHNHTTDTMDWTGANEVGHLVINFAIKL